MLRKHVTFYEILLLKSTISQQEERLKTKSVSQRMEVDATPPPLVGTISVEISSDVIPDGDHIAMMDTEQVEQVAVNWVSISGVDKSPKGYTWVPA